MPRAASERHVQVEPACQPAAEGSPDSAALGGAGRHGESQRWLGLQLLLQLQEALTAQSESVLLRTQDSLAFGKDCLKNCIEHGSQNRCIITVYVPRC